MGFLDKDFFAGCNLSRGKFGSCRLDKLSSTIQCFFNKFKTCQNSDNFSFQFTANPTVYVIESQIPELWLASKNPVDKNQIYHGSSYNPQRNLYPRIPFVIPVQDSFRSKEVNIGKIDLDDLFGTSNEGAEKTNQAVEEGTKSKEEEKKEERKDEEKKEDQLSTQKKWYISFQNSAFYGPYTGREIFSFLNNVRESKIKVPEFMVADSESDFYFKPESLHEILSEEIKGKDIDISNKDPENCHNLEKAVRKRSDSPIYEERKYIDASRMVTKFDVAEMNSKFKNAQNLPIHNLRFQLNTVKNKTSKHQQFFPVLNSTKSVKTPRNKFEFGGNYNINLINSNSSKEVDSSSGAKFTNISTEQLFA